MSTLSALGDDAGSAVERQERDPSDSRSAPGRLDSTAEEIYERLVVASILASRLICCVNTSALHPLISTCTCVITVSIKTKRERLAKR